MWLWLWLWLVVWLVGWLVVVVVVVVVVAAVAVAVVVVVCWLLVVAAAAVVAVAAVAVAVVVVVVSAEQPEGHPVCAPTPVHVQGRAGTVHRVRRLRVRPFSMIPPRRQSHSFGGSTIGSTFNLI